MLPIHPVKLRLARLSPPILTHLALFAAFSTHSANLSSIDSNPLLVPPNMGTPFFAESGPWPDSPPRLNMAPDLADMLRVFSPQLNAPLPSPPLDSRGFSHGPYPIPSSPLDDFPGPDPDDLMRQFKWLNKSQRFSFLSSLVGELRLHEALVVSRRIEPRLRRDFFRELPLELALHCLSFVSLALWLR